MLSNCIWSCCFFVSHVHCFDRCLIFRLTKSQRVKQQGPLHDRHDFTHVSHLTMDSTLSCVCWSQMTSSKDEEVANVAISECVTDGLTTFWSTSFVIYYWTEARQHGIYTKQTTSDKAFLFQNLSTSKASLCPLWRTRKSHLTLCMVYTKWSNVIGCYA